MMRRRFPIVIALAVLLPLSSLEATQAPPARVHQGRTIPPPGWRETVDKSLDLALQNRHADVIALWEAWVKRHPEYPEGLVMLGAGYENMGVSIRVNGDPDAVAKSAQMYETAAVYYRRAIELKGEGADFDMMRGLVDLYGPFRLNRPDERVRLGRDGAARFPAEPLAHAYAICAIAESGAPIDEAVNTARTSVPRTAAAQSVLGGSLLSCARDWRGSDRIASLVLQQALDFTDEALRIAPSDADRKQRSEILLEQAKHRR